MTEINPTGEVPNVNAPDDPTANRVVNTENAHLQDGVNRCPRCGASEVQLKVSSGKLMCLFCRHEWSEQTIGTVGGVSDLNQLQGTIIASGASNIQQAADDSLRTLKCQGCGAEIVVNTDENMLSRCHWCRHVLGINDQMPNGAVPDAVLPFHITHQQAVSLINKFAAKRRAFAHSGFKRDFKPENIVGVYMPYMVVDSKATAEIHGCGEIETKRYTVSRGDDDSETVYDADIYRVDRRLSYTVDDLTIEASAERANFDISRNTNNIINTILPFDTENAVKWNASYLTGFTSERRDQNIAELQPILEDYLLSIARSEAVESIKQYDRGVRWESESLQIHGTRWLAMYLPVWIYSYYLPGKTPGQGMVHYIAVNGRTGETMGSVPISRGKLLLAALSCGTVVEAIALAIVGFALL